MILEMRGIEPRASPVQSEHSTIWATFPVVYASLFLNLIFQCLIFVATDEESMNGRIQGNPFTYHLLKASTNPLYAAKLAKKIDAIAIEQLATIQRTVVPRFHQPGIEWSCSPCGGLQLVWKRGFRRVLLETDSLVVRQKVTQQGIKVVPYGWLVGKCHGEGLMSKNQSADRENQYSCGSARKRTTYFWHPTHQEALQIA